MLGNLKADFQIKKKMNLIVFYKVNIDVGDESSFRTRVMME